MASKALRGILRNGQPGDARPLGLTVLAMAAEHGVEELDPVTHPSGGRIASGAAAILNSHAPFRPDAVDRQRSRLNHPLVEEGVDAVVLHVADAGSDASVHAMHNIGIRLTISPTEL